MVYESNEITLAKLVDGSDAYSVVISSNKGTLFKGDVESVETTSTCNVYKGTILIEPNSYTWVYADQNSDTWNVLGYGKTLTTTIPSSIIRKCVKCIVDV